MKNLFNFRIVTLVILFLVSALIGGILSSCGKSSHIRERWVDNDTYRIRSRGVPPIEETNIIRRKTASKRVALLNAQYLIIEKYGPKTSIEGEGVSNTANDDSVIYYEFKVIIKGGEIIKLVYDKEQNCEIIYEIKGKNLKKKIRSFLSGD
jgi:hypothetical protein